MACLSASLVAADIPVKNGFIHFDVERAADGASASAKTGRLLRRWHTEPDAPTPGPELFACEVPGIDEVESSDSLTLALSSALSDASTDICTPEPSPRGLHRGDWGLPLAAHPAAPPSPSATLSPGGSSSLDASAPCFEPSRGSRALPTASAPGQAFFMVHSFQFTLRLADGMGLGLDVLAVDRALVVEQVLTHGAVESWNSIQTDAGCFSSRSLMAGDVIEAVNDKTDNMVELCQSGQLLKFRVKRTSSVSGPYLAPRPCLSSRAAVGLCARFGSCCEDCRGCAPQVAVEHRLHPSKEPVELAHL